MIGRNTYNESGRQQIERNRRAARQNAADETMDFVGLVALLRDSEVLEADWRAVG